MWKVTLAVSAVLLHHSCFATESSTSQLLQRIAELEAENGRLKAGLQGIGESVASLLLDSAVLAKSGGLHAAVVDALGGSTCDGSESAPEDPPPAVTNAHYAVVRDGSGDVFLPRGTVWCVMTPLMLYYFVWNHLLLGFRFPPRYQVEPSQFVDGVGPQRLYVMPRFLSRSDCDFLIKYATSKFKPSEIMRDPTVQGDELRVTTTRDSNSAYIDNAEVNAVPRLRAILERMHSVAGVSFELGETFQVTECERVWVSSTFRVP
jgi:hypothetical protein